MKRTALRKILDNQERSAAWLSQKMLLAGYKWATPWTIVRIVSGKRKRTTDKEKTQIQKILPEWEG